MRCATTASVTLLAVIPAVVSYGHMHALVLAQCQPVGHVGTFEFTARLWRYPGDGGWYFVSLPPEIGAEITDITAGIRRGFGSVRVAVTVGSCAWQTSIFPDSKAGTYLLPVKRAVRAAELLEAGDDIRARVEIVGL
ncbi:MAG TPA: DUF1905 domain-containing protein [Streptosporangiaceae bacterium]